MKKTGISNKSYDGAIRKVVATSYREKRLLVDNDFFDEDEVVVTGLARFDKLTGKVEKNNYIWIMPTWRDWICDAEEKFMDSDFYKYYESVLTDENLLSYLRDNKLRIVFCLHVEFEKYKYYFDKFENDVVHITDMHEKSMSERIQECLMVVTDYSSIIFDVVYLKKPVLFFQFDQDIYIKERGSFIDLKKDLPGEVVYDSLAAINSIIKLANNNFVNEAVYEERRGDYFEYNDFNNSKRIYEAIIACREE